MGKIAHNEIDFRPSPDKLAEYLRMEGQTWMPVPCMSVSDNGLSTSVSTNTHYQLLSRINPEFLAWCAAERHVCFLRTPTKQLTILRPFFATSGKAEHQAFSETPWPSEPFMPPPEAPVPPKPRLIGTATIDPDAIHKHGEEKKKRRRPKRRGR
jgi:hypothetical protein